MTADVRDPLGRRCDVLALDAAGRLCEPTDPAAVWIEVTAFDDDGAAVERTYLERGASPDAYLARPETSDRLAT